MRAEDKIREALLRGRKSNSRPMIDYATKREQFISARVRQLAVEFPEDEFDGDHAARMKFLRAKAESDFEAEAEKHRTDVEEEARRESYETSNKGQSTFEAYLNSPDRRARIRRGESVAATDALMAQFAARRGEDPLAAQLDEEPKSLPELMDEKFGKGSQSSDG